MDNILCGDKYRISVLTPSLLRIEYSREGRFVDSKTKVISNRVFPEVPITVIEKDDYLEIETSELILFYDKGEFTASGLSIRMKSKFNDYSDTWHFGDNVETLKGTARTLDCADGAVPLEEGIIGRQGFAVLDDSETFLVDSGNNIIVKPFSSTDIYFFGYQHNYVGALHDFYLLTGAPPLLPRFALGNWWSRYWKYTSDSYRELLDKFRKAKIPLSVAVLDMDWHLTEIPSEFGSSWTGYTWNNKLFPKPQQFLQELHDDGLKVSLNVHPAEGIRQFEDCYDRIADRMQLDKHRKQTAIFDLTNDVFREGYFQDVHHPLEEQGVDFWWIDWQQGHRSRIKGVDPLWLLNFYHYLDSDERHDEGLILSRYAGPGSHRYPIGFSGDTVMSWSSLAFQPYFTSTASNIGYGWWSHDIGGHMHGVRDEELIARWVQLGVFSPINRLHSSNNVFMSKEPWEYSQEIQEIISKQLCDRHRLLPYLYTMNVRSHEKLVPLILPLYYHNPESEGAYSYRNEYYFGDQLIVMPITSRISSKYRYAKESVWFPHGTWYDFYQDWQYEGDSYFDIYRRINEVPVFAKAGAIIPLDKNDAFHKFGVDLPQDIEWHVFPGKSNQFKLVEDKGKERCETIVELNWDSRKISIEIQGNREILPKGRHNYIHLHGMIAQDESDIIFPIYEEQEVSVQCNSELMRDRALSELTNRIKYPKTENDLKEDLWRYLNGDHDFLQKINFLRKYNDDFQMGMLFEPLYILEKE